MTVLETQDIFARALCVWREMRGESPEARLACYWVICNRLLDPHYRWPRTAYEVVTERHQSHFKTVYFYQFSSFDPKDPNAGLIPQKDDAPDWQAWLEICAMCDQPGPDPTAGANAYEAIEDGKPRPTWADSSKLVKTIGKTRFYKL